MPSFEIPDGPTTVTLTAEPVNGQPAYSGNAVFGVTNKSGQGLAGRLSVVPQGEAKKEWFAIQGEGERRFAVGETQTITVAVKPPAGTAAGSYKFRLRVVNVNDPDNDYTEGPVSGFELKPAGAPRPPFPWWAVAAAAALILVVGGAVAAFLLWPRDEAPPDQPPPPAAECRPGFVPRLARADDRVCVTPDSRAMRAKENSAADQRRDPACAGGGCPYGRDQCLQGFVWREAFPGDVVCVPPEIRSLMYEENQLAPSRAGGG